MVGVRKLLGPTLALGNGVPCIKAVEAGRILEDGITLLGKGAWGHGGECAERARYLPSGFPVKEEEELLPHLGDRATRVGAELIPIQSLPGEVKRVAGGEIVIPVELPQRAVIPIATGFGNQVHKRARSASVFGGVSGGHNVKLLN